MNRKVQGEKLTETQKIDNDNLLTDHVIGTWQADYPLREVEFERIKHGRSLILSTAINCGYAVLGFGLNTLAKGFTDIHSITTGEKNVLIIGVLFFMFFLFCSVFFPNERKKTMKKIEKYFKDAPKQRQIFCEKDK